MVAPARAAGVTKALAVEQLPDGMTTVFSYETPGQPGKSCWMQQRWNGEAARFFAISYDPRVSFTRGLYSVQLFDKSRFLADDEVINLALTVGSNPAWKFQGKPLNWGLLFEIKGAEQMTKFMNELSSSKTASMAVGSDVTWSLNLAGNQKLLDAFLKCQVEAGM